MKINSIFKLCALGIGQRPLFGKAWHPKCLSWIFSFPLRRKVTETGRSILNWGTRGKMVSDNWVLRFHITTSATRPAKRPAQSTLHMARYPLGGVPHYPGGVQYKEKRWNFFQRNPGKCWKQGNFGRFWEGKKKGWRKGVQFVRHHVLCHLTVVWSRKALSWGSIFNIPSA